MTWIAAKAKTKRSLAKANSYRFDARLSKDRKVLIQRAADLEGRTMTEFVLHSAQIAAERTIQEREILNLSVRDSLRFAKTILNPRKPGPVLRRAAEHYKKFMASAQ